MIKFTFAALENIEELGFDPMDDVERLRRGDIDEDDLLEELLFGADTNRVEGWYDYVNAVATFAGRPVSAAQLGLPFEGCAL